MKEGSNNRESAHTFGKEILAKGPVISAFNDVAPSTPKKDDSCIFSIAASSSVIEQAVAQSGPSLTQALCALKLARGGTTCNSPLETRLRRLMCFPAPPRQQSNTISMRFKVTAQALSTTCPACSRFMLDSFLMQDIAVQKQGCQQAALPKHTCNNATMPLAFSPRVPCSIQTAENWSTNFCRLAVVGQVD